MIRRPPGSTLFPTRRSSDLPVAPTRLSVEHLDVCVRRGVWSAGRSEEHTSELQSRGHLVCRLLLEKKKTSGLPCLQVAPTKTMASTSGTSPCRVLPIPDAAL